MQIDLGESYPATQIVDAFREAAKREGFGVRDCYATPRQIESGLIENKGVEAYNMRPIRRWILFGPIVYVQDGTCKFVLDPLGMDKEYAAVTADAKISVVIPNVGIREFSSDSSWFQPWKPAWERLMEKFYALLNNPGLNPAR